MTLAEVHPTDRNYPQALKFVGHAAEPISLHHSTQVHGYHMGRVKIQGRVFLFGAIKLKVSRRRTKL